MTAAGDVQRTLKNLYICIPLPSKMDEVRYNDSNLIHFTLVHSILQILLKGVMHAHSRAVAACGEGNIGD